MNDLLSKQVIHKGKRRTTALATMVVLASLLLVSCQSDELSKRDSAAGLNGGFETTDSGHPVNWAFFPNPESDDAFQVSVDTTTVQEGDQSLKLVTDQSDKTVGLRSRRVSVQAGKTYKISFSVQNSGCKLTVRRVVQDASGTNNVRSEIIADTSTDTGGWETFEETLLVSDGESNVVLIFLVDGPGSLWVDDVKVEEVTE
jgi:hypothetical protein